MPVNTNLDKVLDKQYENYSLADLINAPVDALEGVSAGDAEPAPDGRNSYSGHGRRSVGFAP